MMNAVSRTCVTAKSTAFFLFGRHRVALGEKLLSELCLSRDPQ